MADIDLHYVDELIGVRQAQHGGNRGAPPIVGGHRTGASINRSCIVMLSALLQAYVEEVFKEAARRAFPVLGANEPDFESYWKQMKEWGNPNDSNITRLFLKIGIIDVFAGLSWQGTTTAEIRLKLDHLNQLRNRIAHGSRQLTINNAQYSLSLAKVRMFRNFADNFGARFSEHVIQLVP
jgi:hypothetical protein